MNATEPVREVVQYQPRRLRGQYVISTQPGVRKKGRWQVVAAHTLFATHPKDYTRMDITPQNRRDATKVANTLNTLNNLPLFDR